MLRSLRGLSWLPLLLTSLGCFDELSSGLPSTATFAIRETFSSDVAPLTLAVFVGPRLLSLLVEPALLVWVARFRVSRVLSLSTSVMALALLVSAASWDPLSFGLGFALYAPASGIACGLGQAALMDGAPADAERHMTNWTLAGYVGDLGAPLCLWAMTVVGLGWSGAFVACAITLLVVATCLALSGFEFRAARGDPESEAPGLLDAARLVMKNRGLLWWLTASTLCSLMDEVLAALVGLRVHAETGQVAWVSQMVGGFTAGGILGLGILKLTLRRSRATSLLLVSCGVSTLSYLAWLGLETGWLGVFCMVLTGTFASWHYPLTQAKAYRALPGRATLVAAAGQCFTAFDLLLPIGLGLVTDHVGVVAALSVLLLQPLLIGAIAASQARAWTPHY